MKIILILLTSVWSLSMNAQIVNIPDANFKKLLISKGFDLNKDGEIQESEALQIKTIKLTTIFNDASQNGIDERIVSLEGIAFLKNLTELDCSGNKLSSLDVSKNVLLSTLDCSNNLIEHLDLSSNINLTDLVCNTNKLISLDISKCTNLKSIDCHSNKLTSLNVSTNKDLESLFCGQNQLITIDVSKNEMLGELSCWNNQLTQLDLSNNKNIVSLVCTNNKLTKIIVIDIVKARHFEKDATAQWVKK